MKKLSDFSSKYRETEILNKSKYDSAILIQELKTQNYFVCKKLAIQDLNQKQIQTIFKEFDILKSLNHPNILKFKEIIIEKSTMYCISEFCEDGDVAYQIEYKKRKKEIIKEEIIMNWFVQIVYALNHLHSLKIIHRDIKPSKIFITQSGCIKLGGFGFAKILSLHDHASTIVGTHSYMPPEIINADIWSLGCVLYEICELSKAYSANNIITMLKLQSGPIPYLKQKFSSDLQNLVKNLLQLDPKNRPTSAQILTYPYVLKTVTSFYKNKGLEKNIELNMPAKKLQIHSEKKLEKNFIKQNKVIVTKQVLKPPKQMMVVNGKQMNPKLDVQLISPQVNRKNNSVDRRTTKDNNNQKQIVKNIKKQSKKEIINNKIALPEGITLNSESTSPQQVSTGKKAISRPASAEKNTDVEISDSSLFTLSECTDNLNPTIKWSEKLSEFEGLCDQDRLTQTNKQEELDEVLKIYKSHIDWSSLHPNGISEVNGEYLSLSYINEQNSSQELSEDKQFEEKQIIDVQ